VKILTTSIISLFLLSPYSFAKLADTTISGVKVSFNYSEDIFPADWQDSSINAKGEQIAEEEISRSETDLIKALSKYPNALLEANLKAIYLLKSMHFYDNVGFGGTNSTDAVYITNNGL
jgi:hypothetical protein